MDSNTYSTDAPIEPADQRPAGPPVQPPDDLADLTALLDRMAARDLERLSDAARAERVQGLRRLADRLDGQWLKELAWWMPAGRPGPNKAASLGRRPAGCGEVADGQWHGRHRGPYRPGVVPRPLPASGAALCAGELSAAHTEVLATSTLHVPNQAVADAEATLVDAARRLDPTGLRQGGHPRWGHRRPDGADAKGQRRSGRRGWG
jgi:hypothetical protein